MHVGEAKNVGAVLTAAALVGAVSDKKHGEEARASLPGAGSGIEIEVPINEDQVSLITKELNELMSSINCNLEFDYHKEVDFMTVRMIDKETMEVIKEIPPEEMIKNMEKAQTWIGAWLDAYA
ncbi:MAG: flagellar protein FlaG [Selenomonadaceae bacterium]|nr:flagellar protein FlaG [Selenomonadaceae bacterium]